MQRTCVLWSTLVFVACGDSPSTSWRVYRVEHESLGEVAQKVGVGVAALKSINSMKSDQVRDGQGLLVPENTLTGELPVWVPTTPAPEWTACADVEVFTSVDGCAGPACAKPMESEEEEERVVTLGDVSVHLPAWNRLVDDGWLVLTRVDLDGDGSREDVLSALQGVSNGLGVEWWSHVVLQNGKPVAHFSSADFGAHDLVQQARGCALMLVTTSWRRDQLRGDGLYFVAQLHRLERGALRGVEREVVRRYTVRFEAQRFRELDRPVAERELLTWFSDSGAFVWPEPFEPRACTADRIVSLDDDAVLHFESGLELDSTRYVLFDGQTKAGWLEDFRPEERRLGLASRRVLRCAAEDDETRVEVLER